jgi:TonB family protein
VFSEESSVNSLGKFKQVLAVSGVFAMIAAATVTVKPPTALAQNVEQSGDRKVRTRVSPVYPDLAKHTNLAGTVRLEAQIAPNGIVKSVRVIGGHPVLAGAAEDALRKWRYEPSSSETTAVVEFHFTPGS